MNTIMYHRKEQGLSQARLAEKADIHPNTVRLLERGEMWPTLPIARRVAMALGVSVDELWPNDLPAAVGE